MVSNKLTCEKEDVHAYVECQKSIEGVKIKNIPPPYHAPLPDMLEGGLGGLKFGVSVNSIPTRGRQIMPTTFA